MGGGGGGRGNVLEESMWLIASQKQTSTEVIWLNIAVDLQQIFNWNNVENKLKHSFHA